jgi:hypothetical protein
MMIINYESLHCAVFFSLHLLPLSLLQICICSYVFEFMFFLEMRDGVATGYGMDGRSAIPGRGKVFSSP